MRKTIDNPKTEGTADEHTHAHTHPHNRKNLWHTRTHTAQHTAQPGSRHVRRLKVWSYALPAFRPRAPTHTRTSLSAFGGVSTGRGTLHPGVSRVACLEPPPDLYAPPPDLCAPAPTDGLTAFGASTFHGPALWGMGIKFEKIPSEAFASGHLPPRGPR